MLESYCQKFTTILILALVSCILSVMIFSTGTALIGYSYRENFTHGAVPGHRNESQSVAVPEAPLDLDAEVLINMTMRRLENRVLDRQTRSNLYQLQLNKTEKWGPGDHYVYLSHGITDGGLGNWMFQVASLYGVARSSQRIPSLLKSYWTEDYFNNIDLPRFNKTIFFGSDDPKEQNKLASADQGAGKFAYYMPDTNLAFGQSNVMLQGYLQSWKYFDQFHDEVRSMFLFSRKIFGFALGAVWTELKAHYRQKRRNSLKRVLYLLNHPAETDGLNATRLIGIHVRRGDIVTKELHRKHGHEAAPTEYLLRAVHYFRQKYPDAIFLVISNDDEYCKGVFQESWFVFLQQHHEAVDLAVLTIMDDLILSVGSYGWWGAYLSDAKETVYYKNWPRKGSRMASQFNSGDYFLPGWIPME